MNSKGHFLKSIFQVSFSNEDTEAETEFISDWIY